MHIAYICMGENPMHRYSQEVEVLLNLQTKLEDIQRECSAKVVKAGEEAKAEIDAIRIEN